jgi:membrane protein YdbS with pleckstrin-like domain
MSDPTSRTFRPALLPQDHFRSIVAGLITLLTIYGWVDALGRTPLRQALTVQTRLWWIEQIVKLVLAIVCIGVILRKRWSLSPAFWLSIYSLVFVIVRWVFIFREGQFEILVAPVLYALLLWRLWITRKQVAAVQDGVLVEPIT